MNDHPESDYSGFYASSMRSGAEATRYGQSRQQQQQTRFTKSGAGAKEVPVIAQRMNQVSLYDNEYSDGHEVAKYDGQNDSRTKNRSPLPSTVRNDKQRSNAGMFSGQLRNGASRQEFDTDSRLARGNANRAQVQTNEPSFRIQSREVARRRDSETADFAGNSNSTTAALDGASQRNVVADALQPRSVWHTMQDGNSQSQSLVSGSNSQSAVNTSNNAPPGLPNLLTTVGSSLPTKNAVPTILQKPATIKSTTANSGNGSRVVANEQSGESMVLKQTRNERPATSAGDIRAQQSTGKPLHTVITNARSATMSGESKVSTNADSQPAPKEAPTRESVAQEALRNLNDFHKKRPKMRFSVSIADQSFLWDATSACDALTDNTDYLVVGLCGMHAAGKSTVASMLADPSSLRTSPERWPFAVETLADLKTARAATVGINMLVTSERTIILDTQPLLSFALVDAYEDPHRRITFPYEQFVDEQSVKLLAFLFSVCHLVIVVLDGAQGESEARLINLAKVMQLADLVRPSIEHLNLTPSSNSVYVDDGAKSRNAPTRRAQGVATCVSPVADHFVLPPGREAMLSNVHLAFVENKLSAAALTKRHADRIRSALDRCFDEQLSSTLTVRSGVLSMVNSALAPGFDFETNAALNNVNYFALPPFDSGSQTNEQSVANNDLRIGKFETFVRSLRRQVLSAAIREPIAMLAGVNGAQPTPLSEKKWFEYASRCCKAICDIRMPNFPDEFSRFVLDLSGPT